MMMLRRAKKLISLVYTMTHFKLKVEGNYLKKTLISWYIKKRIKQPSHYGRILSFLVLMCPLHLYIIFYLMVNFARCPFGIRNKRRCPWLPFLLNIVLEIHCQCSQTRKRVTTKERNLSLLGSDNYCSKESACDY